MKRLNRKKLIVVAATLAVCMLLPIVASFRSSAQMVDVYTTTGPELQFKNIFGPKSKGYKLSDDVCKMISQENGVYKMQSNAYAIWFENDSASYAYTKSAFNTGDGSIMTIKCTVNDFTGQEIGICLRKSLDAGSETVLVSGRVEHGYFFIDRAKEDAGCNYKQITTTFDYAEDIHYKMVVDKTKGRVSGYYKVGGDINSEEGWTLISAKSCGWIKKCTQLYTGISISTGVETWIGIAEFTNFSVNLQAPEGYKIEDGGDSGDDNSDEPEVTLPEDLEAAGDALLYETFTDNNLFPKDEDKSSVVNPQWIVRSGEPDIKTNDSATNRYLYVQSADEPLMMTAGNMEWTDYSAQMDVMFYSDTLKDESNEVSLLLRHRSAVIGGSGDYSVTIQNKIENGVLKGQYIQLYWRGNESKFLPVSRFVLAEKCLKENDMLELDVKHTVKVEVVDNTFTIYFDDMDTPILTYTDTNKGNGMSNDPHLRGCIGIVARNATAQIDDIVVRKINDPLGGDYDNDIMGNYNEPIPDWIDERYGY